MARNKNGSEKKSGASLKKFSGPICLVLHGLISCYLKHLTTDNVIYFVEKQLLTS